MDVWTSVYKKRRVCGSKDCPRCARQTLLSQSRRMYRQGQDGKTAVHTERQSVERMQRSGARLFPALQKLWRSNGREKRRRETDGAEKPLGFGEWCWEFYARALEHGRTITAFEWVAVDASYAARTFAELEQCADQNQWERYSMTQYGAAGMRVFRNLWEMYKLKKQEGKADDER